MVLKPNYADPRVQKRVMAVLSWCRLFLSTSSASSVSQDELKRVFGFQSNPLSRYLRSMLLVKKGKHRVGKHNCSWLLNGTGMKVVTRDAGQALGEQVGALTVPELVKHTMLEQDLHELTTKQFVMSIGENSNRLCHRFQNIKRDQKEAFWAEFGMHYHFDVVASAPTMLYGYAINVGVPATELTDISDYLADRKAFRKHVAAVGGFDVEVAKRIINGLFNDANFGPNPFWAIFQAMDCDYEAMARLKADAKVTGLRDCIDRLWTLMGDRTGQKFGKDSKWALYYRLERQVLDVMLAECRSQGLAVFPEHDGFISDCEPDVSQVESRVFRETGLAIKLERVSRVVQSKISGSCTCAVDQNFSGSCALALNTGVDGGRGSVKAVCFTSQQPEIFDAGTRARNARAHDAPDEILPDLTVPRHISGETTRARHGAG